MRELGLLGQVLVRGSPISLFFKFQVPRNSAWVFVLGRGSLGPTAQRIPHPNCVVVAAGYHIPKHRDIRCSFWVVEIGTCFLQLWWHILTCREKSSSIAELRERKFKSSNLAQCSA